MSKPAKPSKKKSDLLGFKLVATDYSLDKNKEIHMQYWFKTAKGSFADPKFHTSPRVRDLLNKHSIGEGINIGYIKYFGAKDTAKPKPIQVKTYPFRQLEGQPIYEEIRGGGIASELEKKCLEDMKERYGGDVRLKPWRWAEKGRIKQMEKRGIKIVNNPAPRYDSSVANMIRGINTVRRQNRKKHRK